jgi:hypothetical protein
MDAPTTQPARAWCFASLDAACARYWLAGSAVVALGFVIGRRLAGALQSPASIGTCLLTGFALAIFSRWARKELTSRLGFLPALACGATLAAAGAASITIAGMPAAGLIALWLPIAGEAAWAFGHATTTHRFGMAHESSDPDAIIALDSPLEEMALDDPAIVQHLIRRCDPSGAESIGGVLRAKFSPAERTVNLHVPFCPPLRIAPVCEAEAIDGPPARVKVVQVLPQGARLEVRLDEAATTPQQVVIEFTTT